MMQKITFSILFFLLSFALPAQVLKGKIIDKNGEAIPFAKIRINNTSYGTIANAIGVYQLEVNGMGTQITYSAPGYQGKTDTLLFTQEILVHDVVLAENVQEVDEVVVVSRSAKDRGKEIMKKVIEKRSFYYDQLSEYSCTTYCFTSLEKDKKDTIFKDSVIGREKMNILEWYSTSYFKANKKYKDLMHGFNDVSDKGRPVNSATISFESGEEDYLNLETEITQNPYIFINGIQDADINIFENQIEAPQLCQSPIISPLAYNAFIYYNFYLEKSFLDQENRSVYQIQVSPKFQQEALFEGTLFIQDTFWELLSYDLGINPPALEFFKEMRLICDYRKINDALVPGRREFIYFVKEGKTNINGKVRIMHSDYAFQVDDSREKFWLETSVYDPEALTRDSSYWNKIRPFYLKDEEREFIRTQDSIKNYYESEPYLQEQDSIYNHFSWLDFLFTGWGQRNTFKKQEFFIAGLINQLVPFGVGGYRHRLSFSYSKEFKSGQVIAVDPMIDYGFMNRDLKGEFGASFVYNPKRFSKVYLSIGDVYDFMNNYQSIQGTFAPANRVRNKKLELYHRMELINGLYLKTGIFYSDRQSIGDMKYPSWVKTFGSFSEAQDFVSYRIFMTDIEFAYHFRQKYVLRDNKKIIIGSQWPVLSLMYRKGIPKLLGGQSDFDFFEIRMSDEIKLNTLGNFEFRVLGGSFVRKKDLRLVEHKFFRASDTYFFSNPINSMQLLDTALNTPNSYFQANFIHHFNGFFLNKIWLINKLKLEETIGGGLLLIPDAHFAHAEFYVGLERPFRIKKTLFKLGVYLATADNSFNTAKLNFKFGFNFYDAFHKKWDY